MSTRKTTPKKAVKKAAAPSKAIAPKKKTKPASNRRGRPAGTTKKEEPQQPPVITSPLITPPSTMPEGMIQVTPGLPPAHVRVLPPAGMALLNLIYNLDDKEIHILGERVVSLIRITLNEVHLYPTDKQFEYNNFSIKALHLLKQK